MKKYKLFNTVWLFCTIILLNFSTDAQAISIQPTAGFTARVFNTNPAVNAIVGSSDLGSLYIKKATEDRAILEFNITSLSISMNPIYLNFFMRNIDRPNFSTLSLYGFAGNGLVEINDFYRNDIFITSFTDNGSILANSDPAFVPYSLNVTNIFNDFISNGNSFLSFLLLANTADARYDLNSGGVNSVYAQAISLSDQILLPLPPPSGSGAGSGVGATPVPEPATITLLSIGLVGFAGRKVRRRRNKTIQ